MEYLFDLCAGDVIAAEQRGVAGKQNGAEANTAQD
jgi:hypothetical protein